MNTNLAAARFVTSRATDAADARQLLEILGLLDGDRIADDFTGSAAVNALDRPDVRISERSPFDQRPKVSTAPLGLRVLPPLPVERPKQRQNRPTTRPCGTEAAAKRHVRNGEVRDGKPDCAVCVAGREARNTFVQNPAKHGSQAGYSKHRREGTEKCDACREWNSQKSRDRRAAKKAAA